MKKTIALVVAVSLILSACASGRIGITTLDPNSTRDYAGYAGILVKKPDPNLPNVFVDDSDTYLIVDQDPLLISLKNGNKQIIVWALDSGKPYVFADPPIVIKEVGSSPKIDLKDCPAANSGAGKQWLTCKYTAPGKGKYAYTLRVLNTNNKKVIESDPTWVND